MTSIDLPGPGDSSARRSKPKGPRQGKAADRGKLRIGDDWNAIRIIALSQGNPLKAIAEFVENSIDAHAKTITITRGREHGEHYLSIRDDGDGVPRDEAGRPNFDGCDLIFVLPLNADFEQAPNNTSIVARLFRVIACLCARATEQADCRLCGVLTDFKFDRPQEAIRVALVSKGGGVAWDENF